MARRSKRSTTKDPSKDDYKKCIKSIHSKAVLDSINNAPLNKVLNSLPPPINSG